MRKVGPDLLSRQALPSSENRPVYVSSNVPESTARRTRAKRDRPSDAARLTPLHQPFRLPEVIGRKVANVIVERHTLPVRVTSSCHEIDRGIPPGLALPEAVAGPVTTVSSGEIPVPTGPDGSVPHMVAWLRTLNCSRRLGPRATGDRLSHPATITTADMSNDATTHRMRGSISWYSTLGFGPWDLPQLVADGDTPLNKNLCPRFALLPSPV